MEVRGDRMVQATGQRWPHSRDHKWQNVPVRRIWGGSSALQPGNVLFWFQSLHLVLLLHHGKFRFFSFFYENIPRVTLLCGEISTQPWQWTGRCMSLVVEVIKWDSITPPATRIVTTWKCWMLGQKPGPYCNLKGQDPWEGEATRPVS